MSLESSTAAELVGSVQSLHQVLKCVAHAGVLPGEPGVGQQAVLVRVHDSQPVRATDVARRLGVGPASLSRHVAELESAGMLLREADPDDARAQLLSLTEDGRAAVERATARRAELLGELLDDWDEDRARTAVSLLDEISGVLREGLARDSARRSVESARGAAAHATTAAATAQAATGRGVAK